jgi:hypothetical protein
MSAVVEPEAANRTSSIDANALRSMTGAISAAPAAHDRTGAGRGEASASAAAPASREAIVAARRIALRRPSFPGLQARIRREALTPVRTAVEQEMLREDWLRTYLDASQEADSGRLRVRRLVEEEDPDDDLVAMGSIEISHDGRSLRTFTGKKATEVAIMNCPKSHRLLHVEGATAMGFVVSMQVDQAVASIVTEGMVVRWEGGRHEPDVLLIRDDGRVSVREIKRDENDLRKPRLRRNIAIASEILRRAGFDYSVVYRRDVFANARHRRNAHLFASRGFAHVSRRQLDALDGRLATRGAEATWGEVVDLLDARDPIGAVASAQALVVRRRIEIDLTQRVSDDLPVVIHPAPTIH